MSIYVAVVGASKASESELADAEAVGRLLAQAGAILVCGGRGGVMAARLRRFQDEHVREPGWFPRKAGLDVSALK